MGFPQSYSTKRGKFWDDVPKKLWLDNMKAISQKSKNKGVKNKRITNLSANFIEKFEKKRCHFFAEFSFQVVFFEGVDSFAFS